MLSKGLRPSNYLLITYLVANIANFSCTGIKSISKSYTSYYEDLSSHRLALFHNNSTTSESSNEDTTVNKIDEFISDIYKSKSIRLYTIQAYIGPTRAEAMKCKQLLYSFNLPYKPDMSYEEPNYLVIIGAFTDRLCAQNLHEKIKGSLPKAIIRSMDFNCSPDFIENVISLESGTLEEN
jgi:hypothetical protein